MLKEALFKETTRAKNPCYNPLAELLYHKKTLLFLPRMFKIILLRKMRVFLLANSPVRRLLRKKSKNGLQRVQGRVRTTQT